MASLSPCCDSLKPPSFSFISWLWSPLPEPLHICECDFMSCTIVSLRSEADSRPWKSALLRAPCSYMRVADVHPLDRLAELALLLRPHGQRLLGHLLQAVGDGFGGLGQVELALGEEALVRLDPGGHALLLPRNLDEPADHLLHPLDGVVFLLLLHLLLHRLGHVGQPLGLVARAKRKVGRGLHLAALHSLLGALHVLLHALQVLALLHLLHALVRRLLLLDLGKRLELAAQLLDHLLGLLLLLGQLLQALLLILRALLLLRAALLLAGFLVLLGQLVAQFLEPFLHLLKLLGRVLLRRRLLLIGLLALRALISGRPADPGLLLVVLGIPGLLLVPGLLLRP